MPTMKLRLAGPPERSRPHSFRNSLQPQHDKESRTGTSTLYNRTALLLPGAVRCSERLPSPRRRVGSPAMADAPTRHTFLPFTVV